MPTEEEIDQQQQLLATYRRTLSYLLQQAASYGGLSFAPPVAINSIHESRTNIRRIKEILRGWAVDVMDHPDDEEVPWSDKTRVSATNDEERRSEREQLRALQRRLQALEIQRAQFGELYVPPHVITEIDNIRAQIADVEFRLNRLTPAVDRAALRQMKQRALAAYYAGSFELAEELLQQVVQEAPNDADSSEKLNEVQQELELRSFYLALVDLRNAGNWRAVLQGIVDLEKRRSNFGASAELRAWAENRQRRDERYAAVVTALQTVVEGDPTDELARALLEQTRAAREK
jgi:hypothetical protein